MLEQVVETYLKHLRLKMEQPTLNYLQRLIQHQLSLVPYESFSKFHYFSLAPDYIPPLPLFVQNLIDKGWGGTCFTLNLNFARLLSELGFECSLVRVEPGHIAIMVQITGKKYYVDVGYGSPIMKPVELEAKPRHIMHGFGEEITFTKLSADKYEIDRKSNGKSFVKKQIDWKPLVESDIKEDIRSSYLDSDDNITMRRITAVRFNGHQCFYLRNESMKVMTFRNISEIKMSNFDKWAKLIQEVYQIEIDSLSESLQFLSERDIKLF
ncbi:arylamine N-acetyltransferase [Bacillus sp. FSL K6-3431]|uniref:arylamine N-acetyltransferase n=1 Tax=Bacillus sp. FSL K6-3431 TaxID=2921500 RepID=UPI0030FB5435